jgi:hypothetical protein
MRRGIVDFDPWKPGGDFSAFGSPLLSGLLAAMARNVGDSCDSSSICAALRRLPLGSSPSPLGLSID